MKGTLVKIGISVLITVFSFVALNYNDLWCCASALEKDDFEETSQVESCDYPPVIDDNTPSGNTPLSEGEGEAETCDYPPVIDDNTPSGNTPLSEGEGEAETCNYPPVIDDNTPSGNTPLNLDINEQQS